MRSEVLRFAVLWALLVAGFAQFVACGSQLYRVSMADDHEPGTDGSGSRSESASRAGSTHGLHGVHSPSGWLQLPIEIRIDQSMTTAQVDGIVHAIGVWEWATGKDLFRVSRSGEARTGDSFPTLEASLTDIINGQYLHKQWKLTGKKPVTLATTVWRNLATELDAIETADIRYNSEEYLMGDSLALVAIDQRAVVDMWSLALHELGHLLGLTHISGSEDPYSVMNELLYIGEGLTTRRVSRGDVERIQSIYGCEGDACDIDAHFTRYEQSGGRVDAP